MDLYSNGGNTLDLSASVMDRALLHADCVYKCPNTKVVGHCCRTNHASNTAFRGFGGPQVSLRTMPAECARPASLCILICLPD